MKYPRTRDEFNAREKALKDRNSALETAEAKGVAKGIEQGIEQGIEKGIEQGIEKGIEQGEYKKAVETAKKLLIKGMPIDEVMDITDLSRREVEQISKELT